MKAAWAAVWTIFGAVFRAACVATFRTDTSTKFWVTVIETLFTTIRAEKAFPNSTKMLWFATNAIVITAFSSTSTALVIFISSIPATYDFEKKLQTC